MHSRSSLESENTISNSTSIITSLTRTLITELQIKIWEFACMIPHTQIFTLITRPPPIPFTSKSNRTPEPSISQIQEMLRASWSFHEPADPYPRISNDDFKLYDTHTNGPPGVLSACFLSRKIALNNYQSIHLPEFKDLIDTGNGIWLNKFVKDKIYISATELLTSPQSTLPNYTNWFYPSNPFSPTRFFYPNNTPLSPSRPIFLKPAPPRENVSTLLANATNRVNDLDQRGEFVTAKLYAVPKKGPTLARGAHRLKPYLDNRSCIMPPACHCQHCILLGPYNYGHDSIFKLLKKTEAKENTTDGNDKEIETEIEIQLSLAIDLRAEHYKRAFKYSWPRWAEPDDDDDGSSWYDAGLKEFSSILESGTRLFEFDYEAGVEQKVEEFARQKWNGRNLARDARNVWQWLREHVREYKMREWDGTEEERPALRYFIMSSW